MQQGLGTQLRHLLELLDGDVAQQYRNTGLVYRPRYTPVVRALQSRKTATIGQIAEAAGITQPAATQTVGLMKKDGLVTIAAGQDARQRLVSLSKQGKSILPALESCWAATQAAADGLDAQLASSLSKCLGEAIAALGEKPFHARIHEARVRLESKPGKPKEKKR